MSNYEDKPVRDDYEFRGPGRKPGRLIIGKYDHLMDGKNHQVDYRKYGLRNVQCLQHQLLVRAAILGLKGKTNVVSEWELIFTARMK